LGSTRAAAPGFHAPAASAIIGALDARREMSAHELSVVVARPRDARALAELLSGLERALGDLAWEAIVVGGTAAPPAGGRARRIAADEAAPAAAACVAGLRASRARHLAVVDAADPAAAALLAAMHARLVAEGLDLVVAAHTGRPPASTRLAAAAARWVLGVRLADPFSACFALRRELFEAAAPTLGARPAAVLLELLAAARRPIRLAEIPGPASRPQAPDAIAVLEAGDALVHRASRGLVPFRFVLFAAIGLLGVGVHLAALGALFRGGGLPFAAAQLGATLVAMTSNFALNNALTYRDLRLRGRSFLRGLASFYAVCAVGAALNVAVADRVFRIPAPWALAGLAGALVGSVWNYATSSLVTWRRGPRPGRPTR
jgi:dolichol-phosphate mannosyltransferase